MSPVRGSRHGNSPARGGGGKGSAGASGSSSSTKTQGLTSATTTSAIKPEALPRPESLLPAAVGPHKDFWNEERDEEREVLVTSGVLGAQAHHKTQVPDRLVDLAIRIVDTADVCDQIAQWRAEDRLASGASPGGRKPDLGDRASLVIWLLLALGNSPELGTRAAEMISGQLSPRALDLLGLKSTPRTPVVSASTSASRSAAASRPWYFRALRALHALLDVIDPFPIARHRCYTKQEWADVLAVRKLDENKDRAGVMQARINWVNNRLLAASVQMAPRDVRRQWKGNSCIDATLVPAFGKRGTPTWDKLKDCDPVSIEPDASWYRREGDHRDTSDTDDKKGAKKSAKIVWGWEAHLVVQVTNDPSSATELFPYLVTAISFDKPGFNISGNAMNCYTSMHERGYPTGMVVSDRAYVPNSKAEDLQLPLRALGHGIVSDFRDDQLGITESYGGANQVEGAWGSPGMPEPLVNATIEYRAHTITEETYKLRIAERTRYALRPKERADADGFIPLMCPALGPNATAVCPLKDTAKNNLLASQVTAATAAKRVTIHVPPKHHDRICEQGSVSFPPTAGAKYRQDLAYGSPEWHAMYSVARNTMEGFNGYIKDANHEALDQPGRRRVRGYAAQFLFTTLLVVAANMRKIAHFLARATPDAAGVLQRPVTRKPRRRDRLGSFLPKATAVPKATARPKATTARGVKVRVAASGDPPASQ